MDGGVGQGGGLQRWSPGRQGEDCRTRGGSGRDFSLGVTMSSLRSLAVCQGPVPLVLCLSSLAWRPCDSACPCHHPNRQLEVCLGEVEKSQLFVGILGSCYGYVPPSYSLPDHPHFRWVRQPSLEEGGEHQGRGGHSVSAAWDSHRPLLKTCSECRQRILRVTEVSMRRDLEFRSAEVLASGGSEF